MQTDIDPRDLIGHKAVDRNGDKIGTVDEVYLDDATGEPEWAAVRTGIFGRDAFVPLTTSEFSGEELKVPYDKSLIKESPDFGVGQHLSPAQELQLYRYYGLDTSGPGRPTAPAAGAAAPADADFGAVPVAAGEAVRTGPAADAHERARRAGRDGGHTDRHDRHDRGDGERAATAPAPPAVSNNVRHLVQPPAAQHGPSAAQLAPKQAAEAGPSGPVEITCREERLDISTEWHVLGTARLRKYVTSEAVERRVPVVRERVRVERVPVGDAERAALSEQEIAEAMEEVTLREERPVVRKYLAPIERVRLVVERYTEEELVREELRREQVEVHDGTAQQPSESPQVNTAETSGGMRSAAMAGHAGLATGPVVTPLAARTASGPVRPEPLLPS
ncbi:DUF2382 domain-containing protein [Kitasatospora sp. NBC_01539]|uniref:DUF2382 domain-containing protein n=1 Tax=Kitasatospora sp. NBC_01539 TaxID=2903577 RepID=UPI0038601282